MAKNAAILAGLAVVVMLAVAYVMGSFKGDDQFAQCRAGVVAGDAEIGGPFELVNPAGETVTEADIITEPTLIYFGYTFCPDFCPLDASRNADATDMLAERGYDVTPVFISVDPARDTPEVMGDYAANLHDKMIGLTGSKEQIDAAVKSYRAYYRVPKAEDDLYLVDHSTFTYLVLPEHGFAEFYRSQITPEQMADSVACFVDAA